MHSPVRIRLALALAATLVAAGAEAANLVAYEPSIDNEEIYAAGHTVTLWDDATWQAADAGDFAAFDGILVGQSDCGDVDAPNGIWANSSVWGPVVTGNVLMHSHDDHSCDPSSPTGACADNRYDLVIANCADFATAGDGVGLCISIQCADFSAHAPAGGPASLGIPGIGMFLVDDDDGNDIVIVDPLHPAMDGLTNADLDCWGDSTHAHIQSYPADFEVLATDTSEDACEIKPGPADPNSPAGGDGDVSGPVTIARGAIEDIPTASEWGLAALAALLAAGAITTLRRG